MQNCNIQGKQSAVQKDCSLQGLISYILSLLGEFSFLSGVNERSQWLMASFFLSRGVILSPRLQYLLSKLQGWERIFQTFSQSWICLLNLISFPFLQQLFFHLWWIRTLLMHPSLGKGIKYELMFKIAKEEKHHSRWRSRRWT